MFSPTFGTTVKRGFFDRTFGKLEKGSVRSSIFSLCAAAIGVGVLSLSYVLALCGWVVGACLIVIGALTAYWSLYIMIESAVISESPNFSTLALKSGG